LVGVSVVDDGQLELGNAIGVGDRVDRDNLPARDREAEYHEEPSTRSDMNRGIGQTERPSEDVPELVPIGNGVDVPLG
jgi:hypothetical protein